MLGNLAKSRSFLITVGALTVVFVGLVSFQHSQPFSLGRSHSQPGSDDGLTRMREILARDRRLLADYERKQASLRMEVIKRRKLFQDGRIDKVQVQEAEQTFVAALKRVYEMRHSVVETDIAITEAVLGEKVERLPALPVNGYSETNDLARFNGSMKWSLKEAPRLEKYFSQAFGRRLPITAFGQSETHNRLHFDHRDSMDVGIHPDSVEGRALMEHLRKNGIPFIAFRSAVAGASTGPHIHIGRPSSRISS